MILEGSPPDVALGYAGRCWPVFPCTPDGSKRKRPLTDHGLHDASTDPTIVTAWCRWPRALIGVPTGRLSGFVVLDVDVKHGDRNGFDTLAAVAFGILPQTPMAHTWSGGLHLYFDPEGREIRNTEGTCGRGIGPGLDWRGDGGYVIVPSPGSGYACDSHCTFDRVPLASVPERLLLVEKVRNIACPIRPTRGLSPYAEEALDRAARAIIGAPNGEQEAAINGQAFAIGTLAGAGGIPSHFARRVLIWAAGKVPDLDPGRCVVSRSSKSRVWDDDLNLRAEAETLRFAKLPILQFGLERNKVFEELDIPLWLLDRAVAAERNKLGNGSHNGQGQPLTLDDVEPWPTPVDGVALLDELDRICRPRTDASGKPIFNQIIEFCDRATADKFNALVLGLIRAEHPASLSHPDGRGV